MPKKNVMILGYEISDGGSEEIILSLAKFMNPAKYNVIVACFYGGPVKKVFEKNKIPFYIATGSDLRQKIESMKKLIKEQKINILINNYVPFGPMLASNNVKSIEIVHAPYEWLEKDQGYKTALNKCAKVVCVSKLVYDYMLKHHSHVKSKLIVIDNGIDPAKLQPSVSREEMRKKLNIPPNGIVLGNLSRFTANKGIERNLEIAKILNQKYQNLYFIIPGNYKREPALYETVQKKIKEYNLTNVILPGFISNVADYLQIYDIFIFPSYHSEGVGLALLEAVKMGLPIVTTNVGVVTYDKDMVDGKVGYVIKNYTHEAFSKKIGKLIEDQKLRLEIGERNKKVFKNKYSVLSMVKGYEKIIDELVR